MTEKLISEMDRLSREIQGHLRQEGANRETLRRFLLESRRLDPADADELSDSVVRKLNREKFPPVTELELLLTEDCNQRCDYCFGAGQSLTRPMSSAVARKAIDFLFRESRERPQVKILFFGGEPLLEFGLLREVVEYAEARAGQTGKVAVFNMTTNATLLNRQRCEYLAAHRVKYLVSIDGGREVHDRHRQRPDGESSYRLIVEKIPLLKSFQPWLGARMTVHPDTVERLAESFQGLVDLGFGQFLIAPVTGIKWTERDLDFYRDGMIEIARRLRGELDRGRKLRVNALEESLKRRAGKRNYRGCRAGRQSITVAPDGRLYPCSKMLGVMGRDALPPLGNLEEGITALYDRLRYCGLIPAGPSVCSSCRWEDICTGGCFAVNYQETGEIFRPGPSECRLQERIVEIMQAAEPILGDDYFQRVEAAARKRSEPKG